MPESKKINVDEVLDFSDEDDLIVDGSVRGDFEKVMNKISDYWNELTRLDKKIDELAQNPDKNRKALTEANQRHADTNRARQNLERKHDLAREAYNRHQALTELDKATFDAGYAQASRWVIDASTEQLIAARYRIFRERHGAWGAGSLNRIDKEILKREKRSRPRRQRANSLEIARYSAQPAADGTEKDWNEFYAGLRKATRGMDTDDLNDDFLDLLESSGATFNEEASLETEFRLKAFSFEKIARAWNAEIG